MNRLVAFISVFAAVFQAAAAWYWPFGSEEDAQKPPRMSELMEPASVLIDEASDLAADGKAQDAVAKYREALSALDKIELENPDRVGKPEFATVRNKRAYVNAAIDSLLMSQVRENAKAVAVSDTTELEKKLAAERAGKKGAAGKAEKEEKRATAGEEVEDEVEKPAAKKERKIAKTRSDQIIADIAAGEFEAAAIQIGEMLEEKPNGAAALNLRAALETARGDYKAAEKTLDSAIMSNPRSHYAYYNMARLIIQIRPEAKTTARRYYETGRAIGGPADAQLEGAVR